MTKSHSHRVAHCRRIRYPVLVNLLCDEVSGDGMDCSPPFGGRMWISSWTLRRSDTGHRQGSKLKDDQLAFAVVFVDAIGIFGLSDVWLTCACSQHTRPCKLSVPCNLMARATRTGSTCPKDIFSIRLHECVSMHLRRE